MAETPQQLNLAQIKKRIPHREPMLLVGKVLGWKAEEWIETERHFPADEIFFKGHFPGMPVLPGVIAVEAMAQSAALLTSLSRGLTAETATYLFMAIDDTKFKTPLTPGHTLHMRAEKVFEKLGVFRYHARCDVGGTLAAQCTITAKLVLKDK